MIKITCDKHPNEVSFYITSPEQGTLRIECAWCIMEALERDTNAFKGLGTNGDVAQGEEGTGRPYVIEYINQST